MEKLPLDLLVAANGGDHEAYEQLLHWLSTHCLLQLKRGLARYRHFPNESMEDIRQEVLLTFHRTHQSFDTRRELLPWVNAIIRHKMIDHIRRKDFVVAMTSPDPETLEEFMPGGEMGEDTGVEAILERLTPEQQRILSLSKVEGYTSKEIARQLDISDSKVKVTLHRLLKKIREW